MVSLRPRSRTLAPTLVVAAFTGPPATAADGPTDGLVAHYPLTETSGAVAADVSGGARHAAVVGDATSGGADGLRLGGVDGYLELPDDLLRGLTEVGVSVEVRIAPDQRTPYFVHGLGNSSGGAGNGYLFTTGNAYHKWYLSIDEFGGRGYVPFETTDLASGQWRPATDYALPRRPRHGTVLPVTKAELDRVRAAFP